MLDGICTSTFINRVLWLIDISTNNKIWDTGAVFNQSIDSEDIEAGFNQLIYSGDIGAVFNQLINSEYIRAVINQTIYSES